MKRFLTWATLLTVIASVCAAAIDRPHPRLLMSSSDAATIRANLGKYPLFDAAYNEAKQKVEAALIAPIDVPVPKDAAGYTHERHKQNYVEMQLAGFLYQVTGDVRYANFVKSLLDRYAVLYPTLGKHPAAKALGGGRLFWQSLNETVWLVHVSQAYDCIYESLTPEERARYEKNIFRPMARFFTETSSREFNRIHNHGTWMVSSVGMIGYVMGDEALVQESLHGTKLDDSGGFLRQLDTLFSPDGYYVEGAYYERYALMPFMLYAEVINNNQPELNIFGRRDGLLLKAVHALLQQTYVNGAFIPYNDAIKNKDILSPEVVLAVDIAYAKLGQNPELLSIAKRQNKVSLSIDGLKVAQALAATPEPPPFSYTSREFLDGPEGKSGGVAFLRSGPVTDQSLAVFKYSSFGMEHGHYDKLEILYYNQNREIFSDYGSARFQNIEQKWGGRYLPENKTFAEQTIAHNTVTVDGKSDYDGNYARAETQHSDRHFFDASQPDFQVVSATDHTAYEGVAMQRTIAMVRDARFTDPIVIDVFRLVSADQHTYDLPYYFQGHFLAANVALTSYTAERHPLGKKAGYQHLWLEAEGNAKGPVSFTWLNGNRFYTLTSSADAATHVSFVRIGANDPDFNLRNEPAIILHQQAASHVFATVIEPHGNWDTVNEFTTGEFPQVHSVTVLASNDEGTVVRIEGDKDLKWTLMISNGPDSATATHSISANGETFSWAGNAALAK